MSEQPKFCGYSNCFRPYFKYRGFMPCCEFHYKNPKKWPRDKDGNLIYTGSVFRKASVNQIKKEKASSKCVSIWKPHTSISQEPKEEVFYDCQGYGPQKIVKKSSVANGLTSEESK